MIVAIHAFENTYGGLHGIENHRVVEVEDAKIAREWAEEDSRDVMDSFELTDEFENQAEDEGIEPRSEEWDTYVEECIQENIAYQIWEVVDRYDTIEQMDEDFYNDRDEFVKAHCREIE